MANNWSTHFTGVDLRTGDEFTRSGAIVYDGISAEVNDDFDFAVIGATFLDADIGLYASSPAQREFKKALLARTKHTFIAADYEKFVYPPPRNYQPVLDADRDLAAKAWHALLDDGKVTIITAGGFEAGHNKAAELALSNAAPRLHPHLVDLSATP
jgi:DeoR/GlpR family transcriptional regulator of sugar metabolism